MLKLRNLVPGHIGWDEIILSFELHEWFPRQLYTWFFLCQIIRLTIKIDSRQKKRKINQILISEELQVVIMGNIDVIFSGMSNSQRYPPIFSPYQGGMRYSCFSSWKFKWRKFTKFKKCLDIKTTCIFLMNSPIIEALTQLRSIRTNL